MTYKNTVMVNSVEYDVKVEAPKAAYAATGEDMVYALYFFRCEDDERWPLYIGGRFWDDGSEFLEPVYMTASGNWDYNIYAEVEEEDLRNENNKEDEYSYVLELYGYKDVLYPIVKSFRRAINRGVIHYNGFSDHAILKDGREYKLTVLKDGNGFYSIYVSRVE